MTLNLPALLSHIEAVEQERDEVIKAKEEAEAHCEEACQDAYQRGCNEGYLHGRQDQYNGS